MLIPISIDLNTNTLSLLDMSHVDYREPFFEDTIRRYREKYPDATILNIAIEQYKLITPHQKNPNGFIFNVGRCGSTLLGNMFSFNDKFLVLKEPNVFDHVLAHILQLSEDDLKREELIALLAWLTPTLFQSMRGTERYFILKCSNWNVNAASLLLKLFPTTQAIFLYRDIEAVVHSFMRNSPVFNNMEGSLYPKRYLFFPNIPLGVTSFTNAEFYAHCWRSNCLAALETEPSRVLFWDYQQLVSAPQKSLSVILNHFELSASDKEISQMCKVKKWYSKDISQTQQFEPLQNWDLFSLEQETRILQIAGDIPRHLMARTSSYRY